MGLPQALAWLEDHVNLERASGGRFPPPTLERMERLAALMGDPQHAAPVIHITGTNGKGSTARMVTALLGASGLAAGTYTSPDVERLNERLARSGEPIDDDALGEALLAVAELERSTGVRPNRFEALTLAAFRWFADMAVDVAVLEVGMAGRWDATNVADATVAVVTNVALDHTQVLGPTRAHIAREKAGIVKPGSTLVLGETDPELVPIFTSEPADATWLRDRDFSCPANRLAVGGRSLDLRTPAATYEDVFLPLHGAHQGDNAAAALAAMEAFFGRSIDDEVVRDGLGSVIVPGRFEVVRRSPLVVLDCAHNPAGARAAACTLDEVSGDRHRILVLGLNDDRDPAEMLEALEAGRAELVIACAADWPRAMEPERLAAAASRLGVKAVTAPTIGLAVDHALGEAETIDTVLVTGSFTVVGPARTHLRQLKAAPRSADA